VLSPVRPLWAHALGCADADPASMRAPPPCSPAHAHALPHAIAASDGGPLTKKHRRDSSAGSHLLDVLSHELGITAAQTEQLQGCRENIRKARALRGAALGCPAPTAPRIGRCPCALALCLRLCRALPSSRADACPRFPVRCHARWSHASLTCRTARY
jgi:hypothetical protein